MTFCYHWTYSSLLCFTLLFTRCLTGDIILFLLNKYLNFLFVNNKKDVMVFFFKQ